MPKSYDLARLSSDVLLSELSRLLESDHEITADLLAHMAEVDARKLYLEKACSSTFRYAVDRLHMSEAMAYKRIEAGRTARRFPVIFSMVAAGKLHLTGVTLLAAKLTFENHEELLAAAAHKSKREIEGLLAARFPKPDVPSSIRKTPKQQTDSSAEPPACVPPLAASAETPPAVKTSVPPAASPLATPAATVAATPEAASPAASKATPEKAEAPAAEQRSAPPPLTLSPPAPARSEPRPLSEDRYLVKVTVSRGVRDKLLEAQALLRHRVPNGSLEVVLERALDALLGELRREKFGQTSKPRARSKPPKPGSRHIPNQVKREVVARDGYQCSFVDESGRRCPERGFLELDHLEPHGKGGPSETKNVRMLCRSHNAHAAAKAYGRAWMERKVAAARSGASTGKGAGAKEAGKTGGEGGTSSRPGAGQRAEEAAAQYGNPAVGSVAGQSRGSGRGKLGKGVAPAATPAIAGGEADGSMGWGLAGRIGTAPGEGRHDGARDRQELWGSLAHLESRVARHGAAP